jgi:hypothetical protein
MKTLSKKSVFNFMYDASQGKCYSFIAVGTRFLNAGADLLLKC